MTRKDSVSFNLTTEATLYVEKVVHAVCPAILTRPSQITVHHSEIQGDGFKTLTKDQKVSVS